MICLKCNYHNDDNFKYCRNCGEKLLNNQNNDTDGTLFGILGFILPLVGLILFLAWKDKKPKTAKGAGIGALISVVFSLIIVILMFIGWNTLLTRHNIHGMNHDDYIAKYIGEKYDDECVYYAPTGATSYGRYSSIYLKCNKTGDARIQVESNYTKNDAERVIKDNYLVYKYEQQIKDYFESKISPIFDSYYINSRVSYYSSQVDNNTSFREFLREDDFRFGVQYVIKRSNFTSTDQIRKIAESIYADTSNFVLNIQILEDESFDRFNFDDSYVMFNYYKKYQIIKARDSEEMEYVTYDSDNPIKGENGLH